MRKTDYWQKLEGDVFYHVYNRGINGTPIFTQEKNYHFFLDRWKRLIHPFFDTLAYCLMPNHFHFLVKVKPLTDEVRGVIQEMTTSKSKQLIDGEIAYHTFLEDQFKRLFSSYALAFNKQEKRTGSLFQKRFKRLAATNEYRRCHLLAYIHHNPIHHKFRKRYDGWKFSSYHAYLSDRPTLIARAQVLNWFDDDENKAKKAFLEHHRNFKMDRSLMDYLE